jgi:hypothetical protein
MRWGRGRDFHVRTWGQKQSTCSSAKDQQIAHFLSFKLSGVKHQTLRALLPFLAKRNQTDMLSNFLPWCLLPNQTPIVHTHIYVYIYTHTYCFSSSWVIWSFHFTTLHYTSQLHYISPHFSKFATHGLLHWSWFLSCVSPRPGGAPAPGRGRPSPSAVRRMLASRVAHLHVTSRNISKPPGKNPKPKRSIRSTHNCQNSTHSQLLLAQRPKMKQPPSLSNVFRKCANFVSISVIFATLSGAGKQWFPKKHVKDHLTWNTSPYLKSGRKTHTMCWTRWWAGP